MFWQIVWEYEKQLKCSFDLRLSEYITSYRNVDENIKLSFSFHIFETYQLDDISPLSWRMNEAFFILIPKKRNEKARSEHCKSWHGNFQFVYDFEWISNILTTHFEKLTAVNAVNNVKNHNFAV